MSLFDHYRNNYRLWKQFKALPKQFQTPNGYFPSETYFKYHPTTNFNGVKVLNFGCGNSIYKFPNVINVDVEHKEYVQVLQKDKTLKEQFGDGFDFILANHVLEHVPNWFETLKQMAEILKPGGKLEIFIPPISSDSAFSFRDHINRIGIRSFDGVGPNPLAGSNLTFEHEYAKYTHLKKLQMIRYSIRPCIKWWLLCAWPSLFKFILEHLRNVASEEQYLFVKLP